MSPPSFIGLACSSKVAGIFLLVSLLVTPVSFFTPVVGAQGRARIQDAGAGSLKAPVGRIQPPLPLEQAEARKLGRETYAADFASKSAVRQKSLAALLLDQAYGERDQITRFVLLSEAATALAVSINRSDSWPCQGAPGWITSSSIQLTMKINSTRQK